MTERDPSLLEAEVRSTSARAELHAALNSAVEWFSPDRLKAEATLAATQQIDEAKAALRRSATRHPLATWSAFAAFAALLAYILRRPATALARTSIDAVQTLRQRILRRKKKL